MADLTIPVTIIDRKLAETYPHAQQIAANWESCGAHHVAKCVPCNTEWRFDQLRHASIGYYPGDPVTKPLFQTDPPTIQPLTNIPHGNRYAHRCPMCANDLTLHVLDHVDLCTSNAARRSSHREPPTY